MKKNEERKACFMSNPNKKYKIGYTTGVFDLFHIGHLNILKRAKEVCDYLLVGVSTDELVFKYKNRKPIIPYDERIAIIKAIRYVDEVVQQENRDKMAAYEQYKFDVMFVGNDWRGDALFMEAEYKLNKKGVCVIYFPYTNNVSSTILKKVLEKIYRNIQ